MKINIKLFLFFIVIIFLVPFSSFAEEINSFTQNIEIKENSDFIVEETIVYNFGENALGRHGIYRYIPYKYPNSKRSIEINFIYAKDENGNNYKYTTGKEEDNVFIKIGDPNIYVRGIKTYKIKYTVSGAINYFKDHDELYWNVTGNEWRVSIKESSVSITLPDDVARENFQVICYTGGYGSKESDCIADVSSKRRADFKSKKILNPGEGFTIVAGWPKGITREPTTADKVKKFLSINFLIFLPFIVFPWFFFSWRKKGRDPKGKGTIIAEYEPPEGITPAEAEVVLKEAIENRGITATIIDIARKGYLKIREVESKKFGLFKSKDWEFVREEQLKDTMLTEYEKYLIDSFLFLDKNSVKLSELKENTNLPQDIEEFKNKVMRRTVDKGYFPEKPSSAKAKAISKGEIVIGVFTFIMFFLGRVTVLNIFSIIISTIIVVLFGRAMPRLTKAGKEVEEKLLGFKEFLSVTEKDRVKFHFSPQAHPEKFAEYLPFAIVFGVEKEWAKLFEGIAIPRPEWYEGAWAGGYTAFTMADSISDFSSGFSSSVKGASVAASGGSGFGGGGFSGGGFGGGGGGSW